MTPSPRPRSSKTRGAFWRSTSQKINQKAGKVAVCSFQGRVCPRFDITGEILIFDPEKSSLEPAERIDTSALTPEKRVELLLNKGIRAVMVGGIQEKFLNMLDLHRIEVIWGVIGRVEEVIQAYLQGDLYPRGRIVFSVDADRRTRIQKKKWLMH